MYITIQQVNMLPHTPALHPAVDAQAKVLLLSAYAQAGS